MKSQVVPDLQGLAQARKQKEMMVISCRMDLAAKIAANMMSGLCQRMIAEDQEEWKEDSPVSLPTGQVIAVSLEMAQQLMMASGWFDVMGIKVAQKPDP